CSNRRAFAGRLSKYQVSRALLEKGHCASSQRRRCSGIGCFTTLLHANLNQLRQSPAAAQTPPSTPFGPEALQIGVQYGCSLRQHEAIETTAAGPQAPPDRRQKRLDPGFRTRPRNGRDLGSRWSSVERSVPAPLGQGKL